MISSKTNKERLGALLLDFPAFVWHVLRPRWLGGDWIRYGNRHDRLIKHPCDRGVCCDWEFTRRLHICDVFPGTAKILLHRALAEWSINLKEVPHADALAGIPEISFIIGHRGAARLGHLLKVLKSIAAQRAIRFECIVVEQDAEPHIRDRLPRWVRYIHTPVPSDRPYCRSMAFNQAAGMARAPLLVFHDNDMLVPVEYGAQLSQVFRSGFEVINLKRFIFYLAEAAVVDGHQSLSRPDFKVDHVIENLEAGGSVAVSREAFHVIGGFDEDFIGWGGEDNEFWSRCLARKVWNFTRVPLIHLWHEPQSGKRLANGMGSSTADLYLRRMVIPVAERIRELTSRRRACSVELADDGSMSGRSDSSFVPGLVSVVIPVYNRGQLLDQCVQSVLRQTYENFEIIIVDDGSTDDTPRVVDHLCREHSTKIRGIRKDNAGPGPAREAGRQIARGEFIQYLDSDDVLDCRKFESQVALLNARPDVDVAYGITRLVDSKGDVLKPVYRWSGEVRDALYPGLLVDRWWSSHTPLWRKTLSDKIGPWSSLRYSEDWEYEARAGGLGAKLGSVGQVVCDVRAHGGARETRSGRWLSPADQVTFFQVLYENATRAGVAAYGPEMRHFSRWVFFEARKAGVAGDPGSAVRLMSIAKSARTGFRGDLMLYRWITFVIGWRLPVRFTDGFNRLRGRKFGRDTRPQSWMNGHE